MVTKIVSVPRDWVVEVSELRLPEAADRRLQELMDRNNEGRLTADERRTLEALAELSEMFSPVRAEALRLLGQGAT